MNRCPSEQQLEFFLEESLGDSERSVLAKHIDRCSRCQAKLEELTSDIRLPAGSSAHLPQTVVLAPAIAETSSVDFFARVKEHPPARSGRSESIHDPYSLAVRRGKFPAVASYEILGELGRGGMGVVYKARHLGLDRLVALKMILAGAHAGPKDQVRFRQEAEAVARLRHPNIIQIYDIGESEGRSFLALEFVDGESLAHLLLGAPQPHLAAARLIETFARAIHYAHQEGIIHRDLKPANILMSIRHSALGLGAEVKSGLDSSTVSCPTSAYCLMPDAIPKITDFGLAKRLDSDSAGSQSGEIVGTPSYMAPEQAVRSSKKNVGPACDVYALGAILYELLTGRPPFRGPSALDTVLLVVHEEPLRPSYLRADLPRDLETTCLKCLAKDPAKRYATAEALAEDLGRFRKGQPIKARPVGVHERIWKWARHRPLSAALVVSFVLIAVMSYTGITWLWREARVARDDMEFQREQAEIARDSMKLEREQAEEARRNEAEQRKQARTSLYFSRIAQSRLQWKLNDFPSAAQTLARCLPAAGQEDNRGWEWHYLQGLFHNDLFTLPHGHSGFGGSAAYDPQGQRIATVVSGPGVGETLLPGEVRVWDAKTGGLMHTWMGPSTLHRLAFHPDGSRLALATTDGIVMIWDAMTGKELLRKDLQQQSVWALAYSPDGKTIASAGANGTVKLLSSTTGQLIYSFNAHSRDIYSVAFHPEKALLASGSADATVKLWNTKTGEQLRVLSGHKLAVVCVAFSPDGQSLVSASGNGNLKIWDLESGRIVQSLTGDTGGVLNVVFSPDGRYLAKAGKDGSVRVWHLTTGVERMAFRGHTTPVEAVHFSPDCQRVVSISPGEGVAKVWDLTRHPEYASFARTEADVEAIVFSNEGERLFSVTAKGKLQAWDSTSGMLLDERLFPLNKSILSPALPVSFSKHGRYIAGRSDMDPCVVKSWDAVTGAENAAYKGHALPVVCIRFSSDSKYLATCACGTQNLDAPHEITVWDAISAKPLTTWTGKGRVFNLAFSPDSRLLAWSGQDGAMAVLEWQSPGKKASFPGHQGDVTGLAFSGDGKLLSSAGMEDRRVKVWKVAELFAAKPRPWHMLTAPSLICDLAFSPDNRRLAAISRDMVKMWDVETGHEALTLRGASQRYWDPSFNPRIAFSPDGTLLAGTNWDESISVWEAPLLDSEEQFAKFQEKRRRFADQRSSFWHLQEAELCLVHKNVSAARFHLNLLRNDLRTGPLQTRTNRLEQALQSAPNK